MSIDLRQKAKEIREQIIAVAVKNGAGHIAPSMSCVEILTALYYSSMNISEANKNSPERDRLVFSKAHGCYGLYAILCDLGMLPEDQWLNYYTEASSLPGCLEKMPDYGIEAGCGSLGHGLPVAVGIAFGARYLSHKFHTFCVMGDGEAQEGTTWEAVQFAVKHKVSGLTIIVDRNRLQAMDFIGNVLDCGPSDLENRFKGFGLDPVLCDGHDPAALAELFTDSKKPGVEKPVLIMANTIKGKGLKCMENVPKFHFRIPSEDELRHG